MKMTVANGVFATLTLTMEMAAKQRAFHTTMINYFSHGDDEIYQQALKALKTQVNTEMELIRAALVQFAEIDSTDLLNGTFEI
jgi:hypothetical protein